MFVNQAYTTSSGLLTHTNSEHLNQAHPCKDCSYKAKRKTLLKYHVNRKHPNLKT